ncbi:hypothetical protein BJY59DRAFT_668533, partial [Rhodotorula toruloides]
MATDAPTGPVVPTKRVVSKAHLEAWLKSGTHDEVVAFVEQLNEAAVGVKLAYERGAHFPGAVVVLCTSAGDVQRALNAAIRLSVFRRRWYDEQIHPT